MSNPYSRSGQRALRRFGLLPLVALVAACASTGEDGATDGPAPDRGGVVVTGAALLDGPGSLLAAMSGKVPNFRVQRHDGQCPDISLRTHVTFQGAVNPHVYVDGTRSTNTCILDSLQGGDVERVEVYPQGFTHRPGYGTHAHGLILVFMRST